MKKGKLSQIDRWRLTVETQSANFLVGRDRVAQTSCIGVAHIPKCGGSAVRNALASLPGTYTGPPYFDLQHFGDPRLVAGLPEDKTADVARGDDLRHLATHHLLLMGHFSVHTLLRAGCRAVAVQVREPRALLLSLYRYWESESDETVRAWGLWGSLLVAAAHMPLAEFLVTPATWPAVDNALWRPILGAGIARSARRARWCRWSWFAARRYREVLPHMAIMEWSIRSDRFVARICEEIRAEQVPDLTRANATVVRGERQAIDAKTMNLLNNLTKSDRALIEKLMADRLLEHRSATDLDSEFVESAQNLGFDLI